jgi:hypothetical protein
MKRYHISADNVSCQRLVVDAPWVIEEVIKDILQDSSEESPLIPKAQKIEREVNKVDDVMSELKKRLERGFSLLYQELK